VACEELFIRSLRRRGFRLTPQREVILSALHQVVGLATVEEILTQVQMISTAVDVSTVYRTLDLLQKLGVVASVVGSDGQRRYELLHHHGPHIHLVCISCGTSPPNPLSAPETAGDFASGEGERSPSPRSGEGAGG
jgi:Fe2+ or Zn2+ uptake regulation protein